MILSVEPRCFIDKRLTYECFISILPGMSIRIHLDDELLKATKALTSETDRALTDVVEDALREEIARHQRKQTKTRIRLTTVGGKGLLPGVALDDSASLADLTEQEDAPRWLQREFQDSFRRRADTDATENLALFPAGATHDLPGD